MKKPVEHSPERVGSFIRWVRVKNRNMSAYMNKFGIHSTKGLLAAVNKTLKDAEIVYKIAERPKTDIPEKRYERYVWEFVYERKEKK